MDLCAADSKARRSWKSITVIPFRRKETDHRLLRINGPPARNGQNAEMMISNRIIHRQVRVDRISRNEHLANLELRTRQVLNDDNFHYHPQQQLDSIERKMNTLAYMFTEEAVKIQQQVTTTTIRCNKLQQPLNRQTDMLDKLIKIASRRRSIRKKLSRSNSRLIHPGRRKKLIVDRRKLAKKQKTIIIKLCNYNHSAESNKDNDHWTCLLYTSPSPRD